MPEFILIQREKQHVVRKLLIRAATMKYPQEKDLFEAKIYNEILGHGPQVVRATSFMREKKHDCGHD